MYGLKMGLNGFAANTPDVVELLANSFNTFTNTSFDAQNIVSELLSSPKACHGAPANQLHPDAS
jgi:hypothetical protein